jgi:integrase
MHGSTRLVSPPKILSPESIRRIKNALETAEKNSRTSHKRFLATRDYAIISTGLDTGLREHEIAALTLGDVYDSAKRAKRWVMLRVYKGHRRFAALAKGSGKGKPGRASKAKPGAEGTAAKVEAKPRAKGRAAKPRVNEAQRVFLPEPLRALLERFLLEKQRRGESMDPDAPLFVGRAGKAIATRTIRHSFALWQKRAEQEHCRFHILRHTAITRFWRKCKDLRATQILARHGGPGVTMKYTHIEDSALERTVEAAAAA